MICCRVNFIILNYQGDDKWIDCGCSHIVVQNIVALLNIIVIKESLSFTL